MNSEYLEGYDRVVSDFDGDMREINDTFLFVVDYVVFNGLNNFRNDKD